MKTTAAKNRREFIRRGYVFRHPSGRLDRQVTDSVEASQTNAAFACERSYSHAVMPHDWLRAYSQGFRIVPVTLRAGATKKEWAKPAADRKEAK